MKTICCLLKWICACDFFQESCKKTMICENSDFPQNKFVYPSLRASFFSQHRHACLLVFFRRINFSNIESFLS